MHEVVLLNAERRAIHNLADVALDLWPDDPEGAYIGLLRACEVLIRRQCADTCDMQQRQADGLAPYKDEPF